MSNASMNCSRFAASVRAERERVRAVEAEERVDAAVVQEAEAAHLIALVAVVAGRKNGTAGIPNMPTFWYRLRRCGILNSCGSPSIDDSPCRAEEAGAGSSTWQPLQLRDAVRDRPEEDVAARLLRGVSESSSARIGFGG